MALIARGPKAAGGTNFSTGKGTILSGEVDTDLNTIYNDYNGDITDANISGSAAINGSKLLAASVAYSKLVLNNSIITTDLTNLSVTNGKIAAGATNTQTAAGASAGVTITGTTETSILTPFAMTATRTAARILLFGTIAGIIRIISGFTMQITINIYKDAGVTLLRSYTTGGPAGPPGTDMFIPYMWPILDFDTGDGATRLYTVKAVLAGTLNLSSFNVNATSRLAAIEFA